jgi:hypothetical protein
MFMFSQNGAWHEPNGFFQNSDEGSMGEGLSRFLSSQVLLSHGISTKVVSNFWVTALWLNGDRGNYVDSARDDAQPDKFTGCATAFIYYLNSQLGFSVNKIIANSASDLGGVYQSLTGRK